MLQRRAILGAAQWRAFQTAPHHSAKLSHLQSLLPRGDKSTIDEINRFVREIYGQKQIGLQIHQLAAEKIEDLVVVGWSDASLANRIDQCGELVKYQVEEGEPFQLIRGDASYGGDGAGGHVREGPTT